MKVLRYSYELPENERIDANPLKTESIELMDSNLLVGKNASGKSTIANVFFGLIEMLKGTTLRLGKYHIELRSDKNYIYTYDCSINVTDSFSIEIIESLYRDTELLLSRTNTNAEIFSVLENKQISINPPNGKLVSQVRRDEKEHPFLEEIIIWAESVHSFKFGHIHSSSFINLPLAKQNNHFSNEDLTSIKDKDLNKILGELKDDTKLKIIEEFNCLGYSVSLLSTKLIGNLNVIYIKENGVKYELQQSELSQGMFRSLFLLIFIHHLIEKENAKMIIIDDLCEGLDYERATKLGKLIFNRMEENNIQFIATSNDYFLMNVIDIKNWNIIYRVGNIIKVKNYINSKDKFDNFKFSGLNNFDLFSSNSLELI